jgi:hypothetical protein
MQINILVDCMKSPFDQVLLGFELGATPPALFVLGIFEIRTIMTYLPGLALNLGPPAVLLSSQDYRREPPAPGSV